MCAMGSPGALGLQGGTGGREGAGGGGRTVGYQMPLIAQWTPPWWLVVVARPPKEEAKDLTFAEALPGPGPQSM